MAFQIAELFATIRADDAQIQGALPNIQRKLKNVQRSMEGVARIARRMFLGVAAVIGLTVKQASDAEEAHNKFMTVFRDEGEAVSKWARDYGQAVGRAQVDMETYLGTIQDTLVPLGLARKEATKLSKEIVKLGLDLASFNNEADSSAIDNLQSALVGQSRAVLKYGVVVNQAMIQQELLNMGIERSYDLTTNQEKVQARLNIIFRSTTDAQGDLIRTQGSFENQSKALVSAIKDMNAQLGQVFIPTMVRAMRAIRGILPSITKWVTQNKGLALAIAGVTTAVLAFLAVAPLLIASLTLIAAHPVVAALVAIAAMLSAVYVKFQLAEGAKRAFFAAAIDSAKTIKDLEDQLTLLRTFKKDAEGDIEARTRKPSVRIKGIYDAPADLRRDLKRYVDMIAKAEDRLKSLLAAQEAATKATKEFNDERERELTAAETAKVGTDDEAIRRSRLSKRQQLKETLFDEVQKLKATAEATDTWEQRKSNILKYWAEQNSKIDKDFDAKELKAKQAQLAKINGLFAQAQADRAALEAKALAMAQEQLAAIAPAQTGFRGLLQFGRGIQERILQKNEDDRRDALLAKVVTANVKQLEEVKKIPPILSALNLGMSGVF